MTHVILTGATGTAGSAVLARCIATPSISRISILSRRPVKQATGIEKARVYIHEDFTSYPDTLLDQLKGANGVIWALGISAAMVDAATYRQITYQYPIAAAKAFAGLSPQFNFVHVSGEGVTRTPSRFTQLFAKVKGEAEASLLSLLSTYPSLRVYNVRPAFIDDTQGPKLREAPPKQFSYRVADAMAPLVRALYPSGISPTGKLAEVLVDLVEEKRTAAKTKEALSGKGVTWEAAKADELGVLLENVGLRRLAGLS